jgi:hypothetical protein
MCIPTIDDPHLVIPVPAAELKRLREDAARYRWLREYAVMSDSGPWCVDFESPQHADTRPIDGVELDTAIDAVMDAARMAVGFGEALELTRKAVEK